MAFAFSERTALQPPARAAANSQSVPEAPRPRFVSAVWNSAFSFAGFSMPRLPVDEQQPQLPKVGEVPKAAASDLDSQNQNAAPPLAWPDHLRDAYKLGRVYGHGAFGTIRLARHRATGESVAIKVLSKSRPQQTRARTVGKLLREAECLARVQSCENVVSLRGIFEDASSAYLVMDHCSGGDLEQLLERHGPLQEHQVAAVVWEVLKVVTACHAAGVCHGDIKPANFLLSRKLPRPLHLVPAGARPDDGPWLVAIDFGCAQLAPPTKQLTRRTGTPVYMAPEVFQRKYTRAADLWSVGMMAYHLLSGRFPFWDSMEGCKASSLDEVMDRVTHAEIRLDHGPFLNMSPEGLDLLRGLFRRDAVARLTAAEAQLHPWFAAQLGWEAESLRIAVELPAILDKLAALPTPSPAPAPVPAPAPAQPRVANNVVPHVTNSQKGSDAEQHQQQDAWSAPPAAAAEPVRSLA